MKSYFVLLLLLMNFLCFSQNIYSSQIDSTICEKRDTLYSIPVIGEKLFDSYIDANFVYPEHEIENVIDTVWVSFNVNLNGVIKDLIILKGGTKLVNEEVLRVFRILPSFTFFPFKEEGMCIDHRFNYPVKVNGRGENKYNTKFINKGEELDTQPEYIGGAGELAVFIQQNFTIPIESIEMGEQCCTIWFEFVIEVDGSVSNVKILRCNSLSLGKEGIRVVKLLANWKPGMIDGVPVRSYYTMPIKS